MFTLDKEPTITSHFHIISQNNKKLTIYAVTLTPENDRILDLKSN